jgi:hypothetical protein
VPATYCEQVPPLATLEELTLLCTLELTELLLTDELEAIEELLLMTDELELLTATELLEPASQAPLLLQCCHGPEWLAGLLLRVQ